MDSVTRQYHTYPLCKFPQMAVSLVILTEPQDLLLRRTIVSQYHPTDQDFHLSLLPACVSGASFSNDDIHCHRAKHRVPDCFCHDLGLTMQTHQGRLAALGRGRPLLVQQHQCPRLVCSSHQHGPGSHCYGAATARAVSAQSLTAQEAFCHVHVQSRNLVSLRLAYHVFSYDRHLLTADAAQCHFGQYRPTQLTHSFCRDQ